MFEDKRDLYNKYLSEINGIKFTSREIDIISCVLNNRGNKKISAILSISHRTVDSHTYNIISKLSKNSREGIIDFIEKSGKLSYVRKYYFYLVIESAFEKSLIQISKTINKDVIIYSIDNMNLSEKSEESSRVIIQKLQQLQRDLKLANVILERKSEQSLCFCVLKHQNGKDDQQRGIGLLFDDSVPSQDQNVEYVNFTAGNNYYFSVFDLLKNIINKPELEAIKEKFVSEYNALTCDHAEETR